MTALALIPGLNNTRHLWHDLVARMPASIRCHPVDCSPLPTLEGIAADLLAELPDTFFLCGFSFGGWVALAMLEQAPQRILGLALVCSSDSRDGERQLAAREKSIVKASGGGYEDMIRAQAPHLFHPDNLHDHDMIRQREDMVPLYGADRFIAHTRAAIARPDRSEMLRDARVPLLIVAADDDRIISKQSQAEMASRLPQAGFRSIAGAGHMLPLERPGPLADELGRWIGSVI